MRAILSAPGSRGDVNPMVAIGRELRRRGHEVFISLADTYAYVAESAGLIPQSLFSNEESDRLLSRPEMWKPIRGIRGILRELMVPVIHRHMDVIKRLHRPGDTILVSHPLDLASSVFREQNPETRLVGVHLAPAMLRSATSPPRMLPWQPHGPDALIRSAYRIMDRFLIDPILAPELQRYRQASGLPMVRQVMDRWWLSPDGVVAMYPGWFAKELLGEYPGVHPAGFPLSDLANVESLDEVDVGFDAPPIVFTSGTAHYHSLKFFQRAADACQKINRPGLLLTTHPQNIPPGLPGNVRAMGYVPFAKLLPKCAAIVHHGGIGTTSAALSAGIPQLIRPMAYDQFDNADRVRSLGCGSTLGGNRRLAAELDRLVTQSNHGVLQKIAGEARRGDGARSAADFIEKVASR